MSLSSWTGKSRESLCQSNVPCKHHSLIPFPLQSNFVKCLSVTTVFHFFTSAFSNLLQHSFVPYRVSTNPVDHFPMLTETVPLVAFTTESLFLEILQCPHDLVFSDLIFHLHLFPLKAPLLHLFLRLLFPQILMFFRALYILCAGIFTYSPGFHGLPLRKIPGDFRPTYRTEKKYD